MKVKELIRQLLNTDLENEVRIISNNKIDCTPNLYLSFDDLGDVLLYETEEEKEE